MRTTIHKKVGGHLGQYEDWWHLVENADGTRHIEHEWDYVTVGTGAGNRGSETMTVNEFLHGQYPEKAKEALRAALQIK